MVTEKQSNSQRQSSVSKTLFHTLQFINVLQLKLFFYVGYSGSQPLQNFDYKKSQCVTGPAIHLGVCSKTAEKFSLITHFPKLEDSYKSQTTQYFSMGNEIVVVDLKVNWEHVLNTPFFKKACNIIK